MKILVINGPNMNLLGLREPDIYGRQTYADLVDVLQKRADELGVEISFMQSNHEGDLVDVHMSDVKSRDDFRQVSYIRQACIATFMGKGFGSYIEALELLKSRYDEQKGS